MNQRILLVACGHIEQNWRQCLAALAVAGLLLAAAGLLAGEPGGLLVFVGAYLCLYSLIVASSRLPDNVLGQRIDRGLERWVRSGGAGFYGLMSLTRFVQLEGIDLISGLASFSVDLGGIVLERVIGFSLQSLQNFVVAFTWPVTLLHGTDVFAAGLLALLLWAIYAIGARVFPESHGRLQKPAKAKPEPISGP